MITFFDSIKNNLLDLHSQSICSLNLQIIAEHFLLDLQMILNHQMGEQDKQTWVAIWIEGFYQSILQQSPIKKTTFDIRSKRWANHFGTPTIIFLLTHESRIKKLSDFYTKIFMKIKTDFALSYEIKPLKGLQYDNDNNVLIDMNALNKIPVPQKEVEGSLQKTYNDLGGFTMMPCDYYSQQFINYADKNAILLELGIGFGAASLQALTSGATLFCNDIEPKNLAVMHNRYLRTMEKPIPSITGDFNKLVLLQGAFPDELSNLPSQSFDAILICRLLHFFTGKKIEFCLDRIFNLLKKGGKLFLICEAPFLKNWERFIPEYHTRIARGEEWPGEITNPSFFETSGRSAALPDFFHLISKEILERTLKRTQFKIEELSYIDRRGQFPDDIVLDGRESVGAVAVKNNF